MIGVSDNCFLFYKIKNTKSKFGKWLFSWFPSFSVFSNRPFQKTTKSCFPCFSYCSENKEKTASLRVFNLVFSVLSLWYFLRHVCNLQHVYYESLYQHDTKVRFATLASLLSNLSWNFCRAFSFQACFFLVTLFGFWENLDFFSWGL